jgi:hypothetical protein
VEIYYLNSLSEKVSLSKKPYSTDKNSLYDLAFNLSVISSPLREGGKVVQQKRSCKEKSLSLYVYGDTQEEHNAALNRLAEVTQADVELLTPGRLYIGEQYLSCYISESAKSVSKDWTTVTGVTLTILPENPFWCTERSFSLYYSGNTSGEEQSYPRRYNKRYAGGLGTTSLYNEGYSDCPMKITIYGPAENPKFYVDNSLVGLNVNILSGEYAVIDQRDKTVYKVLESGEKINIFGSRIKNGNTFKYAKPGTSVLSCLDSASLDVVLIIQRGEPLWN